MPEFSLPIANLVCFDRTDIEQEVNGVYSFDRKAKIDPTRMKAIFDKAAKIYLDGVQDDKKWEVSASGAGLPISS